MSWFRRFPEPIELPDGRKLVTLEDAAKYIQKLPKAEHKKQQWQDAVEHLLRASGDSEAWLHFAYLFMIKAANHGKAEPVEEPRKKAAKKYRVVR
jgi:hypothetical protein